VLVLALGTIGTVLLGERLLAQRRAGRARRRSDAVLAAAVAVASVGTLWTAGLLVAGGGVVPVPPDALRVAGRPSVVSPGSAVSPEPVREASTDVPPLLGRAFAWPAPLPGATPFGLADLAVVAGVIVGGAAIGLGRRRAAARPTRIEEGAVALLGTPASPAVAQVAGWELRCPAGVFVVDAHGDEAIVVVGVGEVVADDGISAPIKVPAGHGTTVSPFGGIGAVEPIPQAELDRDPLLWSHGRRERVLEAVEAGAPRRGVARRRALASGAAAVVVVLALLVVNASVAQVVHVPSSSMAPALEPGDRLLVDKAGDAPQAGEIIVFERPPNDRTSTELLLAKRVVAVGGQSVSLAGGAVLVDGEPVGGGPTAAICDDTEWLVPEGAVFVLGDARADSYDSRCFGPISTELVVGRVRVRVWPPGAAGRVPEPAPR
jgi:signal peptidase I